MNLKASIAQCLSYLLNFRDMRQVLLILKKRTRQPLQGLAYSPLSRTSCVFRKINQPIILRLIRNQVPANTLLALYPLCRYQVFLFFAVGDAHL